LEGLERRRLLAAAVSVVAGKLTVSGAAGGDVVDILKSASGLTVTVGGVPQNISAAVSSILMSGNGGDDKLTIADNVNIKATLQGGAGNDTLKGGSAGDLFQGGDGTDTVDYSSRSAPVTVGIGTLADDGAAGEKDNVNTDIEIVIGGSGADAIKGSSSNNTLIGNAGNDTLDGQAGNDVLDGGTGADLLKGGDGSDTADYSKRTANLTIGIGTLADDGEAGEKDNVQTDIETVLGGSGNDSITGSSASNLLVGNGGGDTLNGGAGNDTLSGDAGADLLDGGIGSDKAINSAGDTVLNIENNTGPFVTAKIVNRVLIIDGTSFDDSITINSGTGLLVIGGGSFNSANYDSIIVHGLGGDDFIHDAIANTPATLDGGDGNDRFEVFTAAASVIGGSGDDVDSFATDGALPQFDGGPGIDTLDDLSGFSYSTFDLTAYPTVENVSNLTAWTLIGNDLDNQLSVIAPGVGTVTVIGGKGNDTLGATSLFNATFDGGEGNDDIAATGILGGAFIYGGPGNDTIIGSDQVDYLYGEEGNDSIYGAGGDDNIDGGTGADVMKGGDGSDTADYSSRTGNLTIGIGTLADDGEAGEKDNVYADIENITCGSGNDSVTGSAVGNTIIGGDGKDTIAAQEGDDFVDGGGGDDLIKGLAGRDTLQGGEDNDSIIGGKGGDVLQGGNGNDTIIGGDAADDTTPTPDNDLIQCGEGDDKAFGGSDNDTIIGGIGLDTLDGGAGDDVVSGEEDNDSITGDAGNDTLSGGLGDDSLDGGAGVDSLTGANGNDLLTDTGITPTVDPGTDDLNDTLPVEGDVTDVDLEVPPIIARATLRGGSGDDTLIVDAGPALLFGDDGNDSLVGGTGDDILSGGLDNDTLEGNDGNDVLDGGANTDTMLGGDGNDAFVNNEGEPDIIDGGDGIDIGQVEEGRVDRFSNVEGRYDQPIDSIVEDPSGGDTDLPIPTDSLTVGGNDLIVDVPLAATPAPTLVDGVLTVVGFTNASNVAIADNVQITQSGATITIVHNSQLTTFPTASVTSIVVDVGGGNDYVILEKADGTLSVTKPAILVGGLGNDSLRGGSGNDVIKGQGGNDSLLGGAGNDLLDGGTSGDYLLGGSVALQGADGADTFKGGDGNDWADYGFRADNVSLTLDGKINDGAANEKDFILSDVENLLGGRGNDLLVGNALVNYLAGGGGSDSLKGGTNDDILVSKYTKDKKADFVFGNAGRDFYTMDDGAVDNYSILDADLFALGNDASIDVSVADQA
jgi:Ca2+-binding RTX toxin-like protein